MHDQLDFPVSTPLVLGVGLSSEGAGEVLVMEQLLVYLEGLRSLARHSFRGHAVPLPVHLPSWGCDGIAQEDSSIIGEDVYDGVHKPDSNGISFYVDRYFAGVIGVVRLGSRS